MYPQTRADVVTTQIDRGNPLRNTIFPRNQSWSDGLTDRFSCYRGGNLSKMILSHQPDRTVPEMALLRLEQIVIWTLWHITSPRLAGCILRGVCTVTDGHRMHAPLLTL